MKKFTKGMLITAGSFFAVGVILGTIGTIGRSYTHEKAGNEEAYSVAQETWNMIRKWDLRWRKGRGESGIAVTYDGIEFDKDHDVVYGSFTDDSLGGTGVSCLDVEIGGGSLVLRQGDHMELKKEGSPECQYYIKGDTFYLKQKCPVAGSVDLTLTLPKEMNLDEVDISMGAGKVTTKDVLNAREVEIEISAGEIVMEEIKTESFSANVAAGSVEVHRLDARDCDIEVSMGSIILEESLVTGDMDAEVSMGDITIFLLDSYEDHDYEVDCGMGEVTISSEDGKVKEFSGFPSAMELSGRNSVGVSKYDLNCSMGSIYMGFSGKNAAGDTVDGMNRMDTMDAVKGELPEIEEVPEMEETPETKETPPEMEDIGLVEGSFPEGIGRKNENMTAEYASFGIQVSEPMVISISCVTESGELDLEIEDSRGREIFDKEDIRTGDYEVRIDSAGIYKVCFEAENHTGSFWIKAKKSG